MEEDEDYHYNYYEYDSEPCEHEYSELDILTGRESCSCGWSRWLSSEEYAARVKFEAEAYDEFYRQADHIADASKEIKS